MADTFFSKSKTAAQRNLSNFAASSLPIVITTELSTESGVAAIEGQFTCIEAVYQAYKYHIGCSRGDQKVKVEMVKSLMDGGAASTGLLSKRAGSKKAMAQQHCRLDSNLWSLTIQKRVMKMAIRARCLVDSVYAAQLEEARVGNFTWFHIETRKPPHKLYWGGCKSKVTGGRVGLNVLGVLMRQVADERYIH